MIFPKKLPFLFSSLAFLFLIFTSCQQKNERPPNYHSEPISYLALGDSYTIGTGIETKQSWPLQLSDSLQSRGFQLDTTQIIATNGWTTSDLLEGISQKNPNRSFNLVSLLIGVNNQYQALDIELYRNEFRELLELAIEFAEDDTSRIFVVSIPNYGVTPFAQSKNPVIIRREIEAYNDIARNISYEYRIPFINITPISEQAADDRSLLAPDDLHPSAKMYRMWIEEIIPIVTKMFSE